MASKGEIRIPDQNQSEADADLDLRLSLSVGDSTLKRESSVPETGTHIAKLIRNAETVHNLGCGAITALGPFHAKVKEEVLASGGSGSGVLSEECGSVKAGPEADTKHDGTLLENYKITPHLSIPCIPCCVKDNNTSRANMPCVTVRSTEPATRTIKGFIYQVSITGDVIIICDCHRRWFSPREFVEHAGFTDVENPLRHIVVVPPSP